MPAQLALTVHEHRDVLTVASDERGFSVDIDNPEVELKADLQSAQARNHVITQVAVITTVDRELRAPLN